MFVEVITSGIVSVIEDVQMQTHSSLVVGTDIDDGDTLLDEIQDGFDEEFCDKKAV